MARVIQRWPELVPRRGRKEEVLASFWILLAFNFNTFSTLIFASIFSSLSLRLWIANDSIWAPFRFPLGAFFDENWLSKWHLIFATILDIILVPFGSPSRPKAPQERPQTLLETLPEPPSPSRWRQEPSGLHFQSNVDNFVNVWACFLEDFVHRRLL